MIGKTIERVVELDYGQALIFTDGTAAELHGLGHEADGVGIEACSEMDVIHEQALQENHRRDRAAGWTRMRERYEAGEMKGFELAFYQTFLDDLETTRAMLNRQFFGS